VIKELTRQSGIAISIDTTKEKVARQALAHGACIINDITALQGSAGMGKLAAETGAGVILMHMKGAPRDMQDDPQYTALLSEVLDYLYQRCESARLAGVAEEQLVVDPGIGFGKTVEHNLRLINRLDAFRSLGRPVLVGPSRKSFLGKILDAPPQDRCEGTATAVTAAILRGASIVRVHDVKQIRRVIQVADAIKTENIDAGEVDPE